MKASFQNRWEDEEFRNAFYGSKEWKAMREFILYRDKVCRKCSLEESPIMASEIDHIIPLKDRPDLRLDPPNLQALCKKCHSSKTYNEVLKGAWERSRVVVPVGRKWKNLDFPNLKPSLKRK
jgi:5-methylcytosine-specific restriction endonuclease McrA